MKAKKKPVSVLTAANLRVDDDARSQTKFLGLSPPPPRPECRLIDGEPAEMARELVRRLRDEAKVL